MREVLVKVVFSEPVLGMRAADEEVYSTYIASKAPDAASKAEEVAAQGVDDVVEKGTTIFPRTDEGIPFFWDYQWLGYLKEACGGLQKEKNEKVAKATSKIKAYKKIIDNNIHIYPRKVLLNIPEGEEVKTLERPLRASTAQGDRVALARSEMLPAGTTTEFIIETPDDYLEAVIEWLNQGQKHGTGQWRSASYGRFTYIAIDADTDEEISRSVVHDPYQDYLKKHQK